MQEERVWSQKFAFYSACLVRLGNFVDAGFAAAVMFEKYIKDELMSAGLRKSRNGDFLSNAIYQLSSRFPMKYQQDQLDELRKIRNSLIIHSDDSFEFYTDKSIKSTIREKVAKLVKFVWHKMDPDTFYKFRNIDAIPRIVADHSVLEIREYYQDDMPEKNSSQGKIKITDFENLIEMRGNFLHLAEYLRHRLLPAYPNLELDIVSKVDATSSHVLMALNIKSDRTDSARDRSMRASATIMATPLDFRVYLGFGVEATIERRAYCSFLRTKQLREYVARHDDLCFFDVEWYAFLTRMVSASECIASDDFFKDIDAFEKRIDSCLDSQKFISWDRMLSGFVLQKQNVSFEEIASSLRKILIIYYLFENYMQEVLTMDTDITWFPREIEKYHGLQGVSYEGSA